MEETLKHYPIDVPIATCYKMRSDDDEWHVLTGSVSAPEFARGAKKLRVFYPDLNVEAPFFVDADQGVIRRGLLWESGSPDEQDRYYIASVFLKKAELDRGETLKHLDDLSTQIAFLKWTMEVESK